MNKQIKNKLMDLVAGPKKNADKHIIICFDDDQTPDIKSSGTFRIVFRDFRKESEITRKAHCKQQ